uniref:MYB transcription factor 06 n=1 Tax=Pleurotus ostreatus TaxID=5322 RepID=A0A2Z5EMV8_PLEOS|nr:MYB transcription factor 06 [Pleurotus ostreatus]
MVGGTIFRPAAKGKARGPSVLSNVSRQASIISDIAPSNDSHAPLAKEAPLQPLVPSGSMLPPSIPPSESIPSSTQGLSQNPPGIIHFSVSPVQPVSSPFALTAPPSISIAPRPTPIPPLLSPVVPSPATAQRPAPRNGSMPPMVASAIPAGGVRQNTPAPPSIASAGTPIGIPRPVPPSVAISTLATIPRPSPPVLPTSQPPSSNRTMFDDFGTNTLHVVDTEPPSSATLNDTGPSTQASNPDLTAPQTSPQDGQRSEQPGSSKQKRQSSRHHAVATEDGTDKVKKRRRKAKTPATDDEDAASDPAPRRRRRKSSTAEEGERETQRRRVRSPSLPRFDPDEGPGEELDPTVITMASLCSDTGQGRISSKAIEIQENYASWRTQSKQKRAKMKELAELKKYGRLTEDGEEAPPPSATTAPNDPSSSTSVGSNGVQGGDEDGFDYTQDVPGNRFNVQVRIGPNGETIIDEESLVVDRAQDVDTSTYTHVVESDTSKFINSGTYRKKCRGSRWSKEETELFFNALSQYGENYELLAFVLPGRDRTACKNKFKVEDKRNPDRINYCLNNRIPVDISTLSRMTGRDFSGPCPEIRQPPPRLPPPAPVVSTEHEEHVQHKQPKHKKRSRSRSMALTDDVVVIGNADTFDPTDD